MIALLLYIQSLIIYLFGGTVEQVVECGPRVCVVLPMIREEEEPIIPEAVPERPSSSLSSASTEWNYFNQYPDSDTLSASEEEFLLSDEAEDSSESDTDSFVWGLHSGGGWNGWNSYEDDL